MHIAQCQHMNIKLEYMEEANHCVTDICCRKEKVDNTVAMEGFSGKDRQI